MRITLILVYCILKLNILTAQSLTINETVSYINKVYVENSDTDKLELLTDGTLKIYNSYSLYIFKMDVNEVKVTYIGTDPYGHAFNITCKKYGEKCIQINRDNPTYSKPVQSKDLYLLKKLYNAYKYLFAMIEENGTYKREDNDPFAPDNFNQNSTLISGINNLENIKLDKFNGIYYVNITIGNLTKKFILDSGASEILISKDLEKELITSGTLKKENYLSPALYRIADGSIIESRRVLIPELKIGTFVVKNVNASIGNGEAPLLLGKSLLDKFKSWTINNLTQTLKLEK